MTIKSIFTAIVLSAPLTVAFASEGPKKHDAFGISPSQPAGLRTIYACGNQHRSASVLVPQGQPDGKKSRLYLWDGADNSEATVHITGPAPSAVTKQADDFCAGRFTPTGLKTILPTNSITITR